MNEGAPRKKGRQASSDFNRRNGVAEKVQEKREGHNQDVGGDNG